MTDLNGKRVLPVVPNSDYLRKQAKARLAAVKAAAPGTRLADVQFVLAREYGFANWAALQAEVAQRNSGPRGARARVQRDHVAPLDPERFRQDADQDVESETHAAFFRAGVIAQIGFVIALVGVSLLFITPDRLHALNAAIGHLAQLAHKTL